MARQEDMEERHRVAALSTRSDVRWSYTCGIPDASLPDSRLNSGSTSRYRRSGRLEEAVWLGAKHEYFLDFYAIITG